MQTDSHEHLAYHQRMQDFVQAFSMTVNQNLTDRHSLHTVKNSDGSDDSPMPLLSGKTSGSGKSPSSKQTSEDTWRTQLDDMIEKGLQERDRMYLALPSSVHAVVKVKTSMPTSLEIMNYVLSRMLQIVSVKDSSMPSDLVGIVAAERKVSAVLLNDGFARIDAHALAMGDHCMQELSVSLGGKPPVVVFKGSITPVLPFCSVRPEVNQDLGRPGSPAALYPTQMQDRASVFCELAGLLQHELQESHGIRFALVSPVEAFLIVAIIALNPIKPTCEQLSGILLRKKWFPFGRAVFGLATKSSGKWPSVDDDSLLAVQLSDRY
eukprot:ANDGO_00562.mRNA.1 hypothetical protein